MAWTTPRTWVTGELVTAALLNAHLRDNLNALVPVGVDAWTAFTPTVKFGATTATVANDSRYMRVGRLVTVNYAFRLTNLNGGTGVISITQPVTPKVLTNVQATYFNTYGGGVVVDMSTGNAYHHFVTQNASADLTLRSPAFPLVTMTHAVPVALAVGGLGVGDEVYATVTYESAT
jgi:hypothetical protein